MSTKGRGSPIALSSADTTSEAMRASTFAAVLLRVVTGIAVASHGIRKILGGAHTMIGSAIAEMGFPAPEVMAWLIALGETTGILLDRKSVV